jgi:hypothetical protein
MAVPDHDTSPQGHDVYATAEADGAYLPMITYIEPADALPFVF